MTALPESAKVTKTESVFGEAGDWERSYCNILEELNNKKLTSLPSTPTTPQLKNRLPKKAKTFSSGDSLVVTHLTTNPPVCSLSVSERTGTRVLCNLWPNVSSRDLVCIYRQNLPIFKGGPYGDLLFLGPQNRGYSPIFRRFQMCVRIIKSGRTKKNFGCMYE
jgi:hypothetical protein